MAISSRKWQVDPLQHDVKIAEANGSGTAWFIRQWNLLLALVKQVTSLSQPSGVTPGTYGDSTNVAQVTVDEFGRVTGAQNVPIAVTGNRSAMFYRNTTQTFPLAGVEELITFDLESYDDGGFIDIGASTSRITIPPGYNRAILYGTCVFLSSTGNKALGIKKNGNYNYPGLGSLGLSATTANIIVNTGVMEVAPGDYFELWGFSNSGGASKQVNPVSFSIIAWNVT